MPGKRAYPVPRARTNHEKFCALFLARDEREDVLALMPSLTAAVETWIHEGIEKAMNLYNRAPESESP